MKVNITLVTTSTWPGEGRRLGLVGAAGPLPPPSGWGVGEPPGVMSVHPSRDRPAGRRPPPAGSRSGAPGARAARRGDAPGHALPAVRPTDVPSLGNGTP